MHNVTDLHMHEIMEYIYIYAYHTHTHAHFICICTIIYHSRKDRKRANTGNKQTTALPQNAEVTLKRIRMSCNSNFAATIALLQRDYGKINIKYVLHTHTRARATTNRWRVHFFIFIFYSHFITDWDLYRKYIVISFSFWRSAIEREKEKEGEIYCTLFSQLSRDCIDSSSSIALFSPWMSIIALITVSTNQPPNAPLRFP